MPRACYDQFDFASAITWLRSVTDLPIAIKGIQTWEDALLCKHYGVHPWLSNHGGRQLDAAPASLGTLLEIRMHCPEVLDSCEVVVDGGITRGSDVVKAIALGAKSVAIGRPMLFALALGSEGLDKAIHILKQEMAATMGLLGVTSVEQLRPSHVRLHHMRIYGVLSLLTGDITGRGERLSLRSCSDACETVIGRDVNIYQIAWIMNRTHVFPTC